MQTIKTKLAETRQRLAGLVPGSGTDIDELARARVLEREKLYLLSEQEAAETQRLEAKRIADLNKRRTAVLKTAGGPIENALKKRNKAIEDFVAAIESAARLAADLPTLFDSATLGLDAATLADLFTDAEQRRIDDALARSIPTISAGQVAAIVKAVVADKPPHVQEAVASLFGQPAYQPGVDRQYDVPAHVRSVPVRDCVQGLSNVPYTPERIAEPAAPEQPEPAGARFDVDLRPVPNPKQRNVEARPTRCINGDVTRPPQHQVVG